MSVILVLKVTDTIAQVCVKGVITFSNNEWRT